MSETAEPPLPEVEDATGLTFSSEDTLLIFDWDDTLLPTSWLQKQGLSLEADSIPTEEEKAQLDAMADHAMQTLHAACSYGTVIFVTNGEHGWVEMSCGKFMPSLLPIVEDIKVISARSMYESGVVTEPSDWKYFAFEDEIGSFCADVLPGGRKNVISLGDSIHERQALIRVAENVGPHCCGKVVKFMERPEVEQLVEEHALIQQLLPQVVYHNAQLDTCIRTN